jgi:DNA helicase II / ATP-dependent DNA helicase PcrA
MVVSEIQRLVARGEAQLGGCAVMYRTNAQSRPIEDAFVRRGVPYKLVGATRFYERQEIKDVLAYLRLVHNPYDGIGLSRVINVPPRGIGQKTVGTGALVGSLGLPVFAALQLLAEADRSGEEIDAPFGSRARGHCWPLPAPGGAEPGPAGAEPLGPARPAAGTDGLRRSPPGRQRRGTGRWENIMELRTVARDYASTWTQRRR